MEEKLINIIDYERAWKKTLLYKFGKKTPSQSWKNQYDRICAAFGHRPQQKSQGFHCSLSPFSDAPLIPGSKDTLFQKWRGDCLCRNSR